MSPSQSPAPHPHAPILPQPPYLDVPIPTSPSLYPHPHIPSPYPHTPLSPSPYSQPHTSILFQSPHFSLCPHIPNPMPPGPHPSPQEPHPHVPISIPVSPSPPISHPPPPPYPSAPNGPTRTAGCRTVARNRGQTVPPCPHHPPGCPIAPPVPPPSSPTCCTLTNDLTGVPCSPSCSLTALCARCNNAAVGAPAGSPKLCWNQEPPSITYRDKGTG